MLTVPHLLCFTVDWLSLTLTVWNWKIVYKVLWKSITEIENTGLYITQTILVDSVVASQKTVIGKKSNARDSNLSTRFSSLTCNDTSYWVFDFEYTRGPHHSPEKHILAINKLEQCYDQIIQAGFLKLLLSPLGKGMTLH